MIRRAARRLKRVTKRSIHAAKRLISSSNTDFIVNIDTPQGTSVLQQTVTIEGWIVTRDRQAQIQQVRLRNGKRLISVNYGLPRKDVANTYPGNKSARNCGFHVEFTLTEGKYSLEADTGSGFKKVYESTLIYTPERLVSNLHNPRLANNMAEHKNLLDNKQLYFYENSTEDNPYVLRSDDPKLVAFYLPQFHPIAQNDAVWGKGFTEWTNVTAAEARYVGHRQPILPADLGFYDLRREGVIADQIALAKSSGIYGFCFYYYWFSGKKILDTPINTFMKHAEWDFNFVICWANENWTKRWDGRDSEVIIAQEYLDSDPLQFIKDVEPIISDKRYITQDGRPVLIVYRASELINPEKYASAWRKYYRKKHKKELHLVAVMGFDDVDPRTYGFDAAIEFAPQTFFLKTSVFEKGKFPLLTVKDKLLDPNFTGMVSDYRQLALNKYQFDHYKFPTYKCVTPAWDNDARRKGSGGLTLCNESPDLYASWLHATLEHEQQSTKNPLVFLNAWNEWAEGAVLEPTSHYGHAVLNRTKEILAAHSNAKAKERHPLFGLRRNSNTTLAVVIHLYYIENWELIKQRLAVLEGIPHDLFVTITRKDQDFAQTLRDYREDITIVTVPNRGRDVLPFLHIANRLAFAGYREVLKLHSKRSVHRRDGNEWFEEVLNNLLPSKQVVGNVLGGLQSQKYSMIGPKHHLVSLYRHMGSNKENLQTLLERVFGKASTKKLINEVRELNYFGGTMFWSTLDILKPLLDVGLVPDDFDVEKGQIDGTLAHAVERAFGVIVHAKGQQLYEVSNNGVEVAQLASPKQKYKYAP